ncbi:MAG: SufD family Fe-S cluster assembly protein [Bacilli bacterium]|nr:SufD family Fe-S cluster assembly protein [Bacilli bacterium]
MSKEIYVLDNNESKDYKYNIEEDTIIYHFSINGSSNVEINLNKENINLYYYYNNINYDDNKLNIKVNHNKDNTHSEVYNHGVNVKDNYLTYNVEGSVLKNSNKCICNQDNQIINIRNGKSTIKPNLLIDNYDVDSNHAAYIGKFKDEYLFYLMSRGISKKNAYLLLLKGFLINSDSIDLGKIDKFLLEIERI